MPFSSPKSRKAVSTFWHRRILVLSRQCLTFGFASESRSIKERKSSRRTDTKPDCQCFQMGPVTNSNTTRSRTAQYRYARDRNSTESQPDRHAAASDLDTKGSIEKYRCRSAIQILCRVATEVFWKSLPSKIPARTSATGRPSATTQHPTNAP